MHLFVYTIFTYENTKIFRLYFFIVDILFFWGYNVRISTKKVKLMIYTLTLNPAIDYIINVKNYTDGAVNRTSGEKLLPGGKGINVSIVLKNLGIESTAMGFVGGFTGKMIEDMLTTSGLGCDFVHLDSGLSRINVKIKAQTETEINAQGPQISNEMLLSLYNKLEQLKEGDTLVMAGSVPSSLPETIYFEIMQKLKDKNIRFVVDATKDLLTSSLKYNPFLIKPNNFELGETFGQMLSTDTQIIDCAQKLQEMGARNVLVSMGKDGAILLSEDGQILKASAPQGKVINTTGAGDSLVAGFLAGLSKGYAYALKMGICAGSASAFSEELATYDEIMSLILTLEEPTLL